MMKHHKALFTFRSSDRGESDLPDGIAEGGWLAANLGAKEQGRICSVLFDSVNENALSKEQDYTAVLLLGTHGYRPPTGQSVDLSGKRPLLGLSLGLEIVKPLEGIRCAF